MAFDTREQSTQDSSPVELYEFNMSPNFWYYTNDLNDHTQGINTFLQTNIARSTISQSDEINRADITITVPRDFAPADTFRITPAAQPMIVTIFRAHKGEAESTVTWKGRVTSLNWSSNTCEIVCTPVFSSLARTGIRRYYSYICSHQLYGSKCRLVQNDYKNTGTVTTINGTSVVSSMFAAAANGQFIGGFIEYLTALGITERRLITSHIGDTVILSSQPSDLINGSVIDAYDGCNHTLSVCNSKFSNTENYGGFPYIPNQSPFGGKVIF